MAASLRLPASLDTSPAARFRLCAFDEESVARRRARIREGEEAESGTGLSHGAGATGVDMGAGGDGTDIE